MAKVINCVCGETVRGETEDEVLDNAEAHVQERHADMADQFPREALAGMARTSDDSGRGGIRSAP